MRAISWFKERRQAKYETLMEDVIRLSSQIARYGKQPDYTAPDGARGVIVGRIYADSRYEKELMIVDTNGILHTVSTEKGYRPVDMQTTKMHILQEIRSLLITCLTPPGELPL